MTTEPTAPDPPPPPSVPAEAGKASAGVRVLALVAALVLFFGAAVMYVIVVNPDDTPRCGEAAASLATECYDVSETQQTISTILAVPAGLLAAAAGLLGLVVAVTGRRGGLMTRLAGAAVAIGVLTVIINRL